MNHIENIIELLNRKNNPALVKQYTSDPWAHFSITEKTVLIKEKETDIRFTSDGVMIYTFYGDIPKIYYKDEPLVLDFLDLLVVKQSKREPDKIISVDNTISNIVLRLL